MYGTTFRSTPHIDDISLGAPESERVLQIAQHAHSPTVNAAVIYTVKTSCAYGRHWPNSRLQYLARRKPANPRITWPELLRSKHLETREHIFPREVTMSAKEKGLVADSMIPRRFTAGVCSFRIQPMQ